MVMEQLQKGRAESKTDVEEEVVRVPEKDPEVEAHVEHSDELLDEIDRILEQNAATFVANFVQKGGQ